MELSDFIVTSGGGKNTSLDKEYRKMINEIVLTNDDERSGRWETYNLIIREFFEIDNCQFFEEIKYRLTDGEDPNKVILDIISRYESEELGGLIWFLKRRVEEYMNDDFYLRFFK